MLTNIVSSMICDIVDDLRRRQGAFKDVPGLGGSGTLPYDDMALEFTFSLNIDYANEEGYRNLKIIVWPKTNYVAVFTQEDWTLWEPKEDEGVSELKRWSYHDSCWRTDGINRIIFEYREKLNCVSVRNTSGFYSLVKLTPEQMNVYNELIRNRG